MKGAVNPKGPFFHLRDRIRGKARPFASSIQLQTNSFSKFPLESRRLRQQQAAFGSLESSRLPVFPELWLLPAIWSPHAHAHTNTPRHTRSWWREQVRESCTCCPVNKIPQSDAETSSFTQRSFPQVWEHECFTKTRRLWLTWINKPAVKQSSELHVAKSEARTAARNKPNYLIALICVALRLLLFNLKVKQHLMINFGWIICQS